SIWMSSFLKVFYKFKQVTIVHGGELTFRTWWRRKFTLMGCDASDRIISVSKYTAEFLYRYGIAQNRVAIIPNGANDGIYKVSGQDLVSLKRKYGYEGKKIILTVG